jgi:hypothetical protein
MLQYIILPDVKIYYIIYYLMLQYIILYYIIFLMSRSKLICVATDCRQEDGDSTSSSVLFCVILFLPTMKPTKPVMQWVLRAPSPIESAQIVSLSTHLNTLPTLKMRGTTPPRSNL